MGHVMRSSKGGQRLAARTLAIGSGLFWGVLFFGLIDLAVPVAKTYGFFDSYLLETGWGVLYTFFVAAAFVSLAVRPWMVMPLVQVALVAVSVAVTAVAAGSWVQLVPALLLALNGYAYVAGRSVTSFAGGPRATLDPVVGALAILAVPPSLWFAVDMVIGFREGRPPLDDDTWGIDHWPMQAALALALAAVAVAIAAGVRARWSGTGVSAACVAVAAAWFGYWSVIYPSHAGSAGQMWGMGLIGWAFAFIVGVVWRLATPPARANAGERRRGSGGLSGVDRGYAADRPDL